MSAVDPQETGIVEGRLARGDEQEYQQTTWDI
jgi:hypothetical protein